MLTKETVAQIAKDFGRKEGDTGSVEVQHINSTHAG